MFWVCGFPSNCAAGFKSTPARLRLCLRRRARFDDSLPRPPPVERLPSQKKSHGPPAARFSGPGFRGSFCATVCERLGSFFATFCEKLGGPLNKEGFTTRGSITFSTEGGKKSPLLRMLGNPHTTMDVSGATLRIQQDGKCPKVTWELHLTCNWTSAVWKGV